MCIAAKDRLPVLARRIVFLACLALCQGWNPLFAQTVFYQSLTPDENDESLSVQALHSDSRGFLWLSTKTELYRYNGRQFTPMLPDSLRGSFSVTAMVSDSSGATWAGAADGRIMHYADERWIAFAPEEGLPRKAILALLFDQGQRLWIATADEGIYVFDGRRLTSIDADDGLPDNYVYTLAAVEDGRVLAGTDRGLSTIAFDGKQKHITVFSSRDGLPDNIVRALAPSGAPGVFWVGMEDQGIVLFDVRHQRGTQVDSGMSWPYGRINAMAASGNRAWASTESGTLLELSAPRGIPGIQPFAPGAVPKIGKLAIDIHGQLWFSHPGKLARTSLRQVRTIDSIAGTPLLAIHALHLGRNGLVWIAQGTDLVRMQMSQGRPVPTGRFRFPGLPVENITSLYEDPGGLLWIGTMGAGIIRLDPRSGRWKTLSGNPVTDNSHVLSIAGRGTDVWVSGLNGIARYSVTTAGTLDSPVPHVNFHKQDGIRSDYVYQVFLDRRGRAWFCTDGAGLACMEQGQIRSFAGKDGLQSTVVYGMTEGPDGILWFNTLEQGIVQYDGKRFSTFYTLPGSQRGAVSAMASDGKALTLVHKRGVDVVEIATGRAIHYGRNQGVNRPQANLNVIAIDSTGTVWVGTDPGIVQVISSELPKQRIPVTVINQFRVFDQPRPADGRIVLDWNENNVTIRYDGLFFPDPEQVRFQYWLEGYHKGWITTNDHEVNFPRLSAGTYRFRVRSAADGRFDLGEEQQLRFVVRLPFWKQWWFISGSSALAVFLVFFVMRQRFRHLQRLEKLQQDKIHAELQTLRAQVNPHFLFNSFNTLMGVLEERPDQALTYTEKLSAFYRNMLTHRETDLVSLDQELSMLDTYIYLQQQRFGEGLLYTVQVPNGARALYHIPPMTLQLLAENAIKHNKSSPGHPLRLNIRLDKERLEITNNIQRKKHPESGEGVGLKNIRDRYQLFSNREILVSDDEQYFTVSLPLINIQDHAYPDRRR